MARERFFHRRDESLPKRASGLKREIATSLPRSSSKRKIAPQSLLSDISETDCNTAKIFISLVVISVTSDLFLLRVYLLDMNIPGPLIILALTGAALGIFRQTLAELGWMLLRFSPTSIKLVATVATLTTILGISLMQGKRQSWSFVLLLMAITLIALQAHRTGGRIAARGEPKITVDRATYRDAVGAYQDRNELRSRLVLVLLCGPSIAARVASLGVLSWLPVTPELFPTYLASLFLVFAAAITDSAAIRKYEPIKGRLSLEHPSI